MNFLTPLRETWLYRLNPAFKFAMFILLLLIALLNRQFDFALNQMIVYMAMLVAFSGYSWKKVLLFTSPFILTFISSASTMILFGKGEIIWWSWGLIKISEESFHHGLLLGFKTLSFGALGMLFALTTRPNLLFYALMQQFRLPAKYAYSFIAAIRLLPIVWEELHSRARALEIRGVRYKRSIRGLYERMKLYAVPLLAQSIRRAQRVAVAMEAKRFQFGAERTYYYKTAYSRLDIWFSFLIVVLLIAAYGAAIYFPLVGWEN